MRADRRTTCSMLDYMLEFSLAPVSNNCLRHLCLRCQAHQVTLTWHESSLESLLEAMRSRSMGFERKEDERSPLKSRRCMLSHATCKVFCAL